MSPSCAMRVSVPNTPTMLGVSQGLQADTGLSIIDRYGVKLASIGFVLKKGLAVVWRGPMIGTGVRQLLHDLPWGAEGELDYLVIDLPPGTGNIQLSLCQKVPLTGAVVVSTPQDVALNVAQKAIAMFDQLNTPVLGIEIGRAHV